VEEHQAEEATSETRLRVARPEREPVGTAPRSDAAVFVDAVRRETKNAAWCYRSYYKSNTQALLELSATLDADGYALPAVRQQRIEALVAFFVPWCTEQGKEPEPDAFKSWQAKHPQYRRPAPKPRAPGPPPTPPRLSREDTQSGLASLASALSLEPPAMTGPGVVSARRIESDPERIASGAE
jgi:hypothetical protein